MSSPDFVFNTNTNNTTTTNDLASKMDNININDNEKRNPTFVVGSDNNVNIRKGAKPRRGRTPKKGDNDNDPSASASFPFNSFGMFWGTANPTLSSNPQVNNENNNQQLPGEPTFSVNPPIPPMQDNNSNGYQNPNANVLNSNKEGFSFEGNYNGYVFGQGEEDTPQSKGMSVDDEIIDTDDEDDIQQSHHTASEPVYSFNLGADTSNKVKGKVNKSPKKSRAFVNKNTKSSSPSKSQQDVPPSWWAKPPSDENYDYNTQKTDQGSDNDESDNDDGENNKKSSNIPRSQGDAPAERMASLAELYRKQGKQLYLQEEYEQALAAFNTCLSVAPMQWSSRATVLGNRAASFMMLDRYIEAVEDCEAAVKLDSTMLKLHVRRGRALMRLGHLDASRNAFMYVLPMEGSPREDAQEGLKILKSVKVLVDRLSDLENKLNYSGVLDVTDEILESCPFFHVAHVSRLQALCKLLKFEEAKLHAEKIVCNSHVSIQKLFAHPLARLPAPMIKELEWKEVGVNNIIKADSNAIVQVVLCMGPDMSKYYMKALKNAEAVRNSCGEVMDRISGILYHLHEIITSESNGNSASWSWLSSDLASVREILQRKNAADKAFRANQLSDAVHLYSEALKVDEEALRWNAILLSNRAAAYMSLKRFSEAVSDCNQSISRFPEYSRAYLRRARSYSAMHQYPASIRDFRRYLCSEPTPSDYKDIQNELNLTMEAQTRKLKEDEMRHSRNTYNSSRFTSSNKDNFWKNHGSGSGPGRQGFGFGNNARTNPFKTYDDNGDDDDDDDDFQRFYTNFNQYRRNNANQKNFGSNCRGNTHSHNQNNGRKNVQSDDSDTDKEPEVDNYTLLGINSNATERDIKSAYRKLALKYHPDKNQGDEKSTEMFKKITSAYSILSDKQSRAKYDHTRKYS
jgi:Flp pilus assembly protein TadD